MTTKATINRLATGVPGLDEVLGGGLPELSFNLIAGQPGCGKTTLVARADAAMYQTKRRSAGGVAFHGQAPVERAVPVLRAQDAAGHQPAPQIAGEAAEP